MNRGGVVDAVAISGERLLQKSVRHDAKADRFLLIGETHDAHDTLADDGELEAGQVSSEDINYLSGKMLRAISKGGTQVCKVKPRRRPVELRSFDFEAEQAREGDKFVAGSCKRP